jgi:hypothetical protein
MKTATENFKAIEIKLGEKLFKDLYKNDYPKTYEVIAEEDDEICILQPFEVYLKGTQMFKIWTKKK